MRHVIQVLVLFKCSNPYFLLTTAPLKQCDSSMVVNEDDVIANIDTTILEIQYTLSMPRGSEHQEDEDEVPPQFGTNALMILSQGT